MDWSQLLDASANQEQQGGIDQQLADILARRKAYQPSQHTTGLGSAFGGLADILMRNKFDSQEQALRAQKLDLARQMAAGRGAYAQALNSASAPVQAPPEMIAAPGVTQQSLERDQQQKLAQLQTSGMLSGDPIISGYLQKAPGMAQEQEGLRKAQEERAALNAPQTGAAYAAFAKQLGYPMQEGTPNATAKGLLPLLEKIQAAREANQAKIEAARIAGSSRVTASGMGGGGALDPAALDQAAESYATTGQLPQMGMGAAGAALKRQIANRAAELHPEASLAGNKAGYRADQASLSGLQKQSDAMNSFEMTALKNLDQFLAQADSVVDTGSPLFNAPARKFMKSVAGDPKMTAFNVSRNVAVQEISKVLGGSLGNTAVSDSARHEVQGLISPDASLAQIHEAARILKQDMANRKAAVASQIATVRGRAGGKPEAPEAAAAPAPAAAPHPQDSAAVEWAKKNPADPRAQKILQLNGAQ